MNKKDFMSYCKRFVCDKETIKQYVEEFDKENYTSEDTDLVYKRYLESGKLSTYTMSKRHKVKLFNEGCYVSKNYEKWEDQ